MEKPIIFFSHSSKDKEFLVTLKNKLLRKTSNTIEIFQSSDGASISFGNNWIHKIEENLNYSKLMFVFLSPNSIKSNWIYFESGYSYSKGIKVVPIGINGIDIGSLAPPINLLQGFNITSPDGLNNLTTVINREFSTSFPEDFNNDDYQELLALSNNSIIDNHYSKYIDYVQTEFSRNLLDNVFKENSYSKIEEFLDTKSLKYSKDQVGNIYFSGMVVLKDHNGITFNIDHFKMEENIKLITNFLNIAYQKKFEYFWIKIFFAENIELLSTNFKLSSRLGNVGIEMSQSNAKLYEFKNLKFAIDEKVVNNTDKILLKSRLRVVFPTTSFKNNEVYELINILFEQNIIWIN